MSDEIADGMVRVSCGACGTIPCSCPGNPAPVPEPENEDDPNPSEHPCAGSCRGCGAGVDEACYPPCRCDEGHDCTEAKRIIAARLGPPKEVTQ